MTGPVAGDGTAVAGGTAARACARARNGSGRRTCGRGTKTRAAGRGARRRRDQRAEREGGQERWWAGLGVASVLGRVVEAATATAASAASAP
ncbi:MAG: hypothetical protein ACJ76T_00720, partial [Solirubrobacteraceae bacterium]